MLCHYRAAALPVQNTQGVRNIDPIPASSVSEHIAPVMKDIPPAAIKIGMVHTPERQPP
ncbi:MAG: bifunctional hydroxymethylpyrimidine kinase/phosphomethylpyrimidine kinase [Chitinophagaceae bacterium]